MKSILLFLALLVAPMALADGTTTSTVTTTLTSTTTTSTVTSTTTSTTATSTTTTTTTAASTVTVIYPYPPPKVYPYPPYPYPFQKYELAGGKYKATYDEYEKYGKRVFGEKYKPNTKEYEVSPVELKCPNLKRCKKVDVPNVTPTFELRGPSGTICVYDQGNLNACNLSPAGSFCRLDGKYFGPERVQCDLKTGKCIVKGC